MAKIKFWDARKLLKDKPKARYYFILSGRAKGKTYSVLKVSGEDNTKGLGLFAYIRRFDEDIKSKNMQELFSPQDIRKMTNGKYSKISYWRGFFYYELWETDEETGQLVRVLRNPEPCGVALSLNTWERDKGQDIGARYNGFKHIIIDEAITGQKYLNDEFQVLKNVISSLIRANYDKDTKIWFLANPLSKWCPYFPELGITKEMINTPGNRYEIKYPDTDMTTIFEYIGGDEDNSGAASRIYKEFFAFPNSKGKSQSITNGFWELQDSCHLPSQVYKNSERKKQVFLYFGEEWIRGEIMRYNENGLYYLVWSPSRPPKKGEYYFILNAVTDKYAIIGTGTDHPYAELLNKIMISNQIYYSDNTVADLFHGFLKEANSIER